MLAEAEKVSVEELVRRVVVAYVGKAERGTGGQEPTEEREDAYAHLVELERAIEQHWAKHPGQRTGTENIIVAAMAVLLGVNNGGFDPFFRNSSARWTVFAADAMTYIGRRDAARIVKRAVRAVGRVSAETEIAVEMKKPNSRRDDTLHACDIAFYELTGLPESVMAYARKHAGGLLRE